MAAFEDLENAQVTALCDIDEELLKEQATKHNIPHTFRV